MKRRQIKCFVLLMCAAFVCPAVLSSCSSDAQMPSAAETTAADEQKTAASAIPEPGTDSDLKSLLGIAGGSQVRRVDGIEIVSERIEPVSGSMIYTPNPGGGFFTVNGTIAKNSEIVISVRPYSVLRCKLVLNSDAKKTVKAEICLYKKGELLTSCTQEKMALLEGANDIDVCIDTGEGSPCSGLYAVQFYLDDVLVSENEYEA